MNTSHFYNNGDQAEMAPGFLFSGWTQKRKTIAMGQGRPPTFGSPGILKKESFSSPGPKNVRWSSDLVQEQSPSARAAMAASMQPNSTWKNSPSTFSRGPPLRSIASDETEPPAKLQRADVNLERREAARDAINGLSNAFNGSIAKGEPSDYWVTVFGFPTADRDLVLNLFARHANIVNHKSPPTGNWIHIRYSAVEHVQQALRRNGNTIEARFMIGVVPCTDKETIEDPDVNPLNASNTYANVSFTSPIMHSTVRAANDDEFLNGCRASAGITDAASFNRSRLSNLSRNGVRSLRAADANISLDTSNHNGSFLSKFWSYVAPQ